MIQSVDADRKLFLRDGASYSAMEEPVVPPGKKTSFASPAMVWVIVAIIAISFVLFLVLRPR